LRLVLLLGPQMQHGHASLLFVALAPLLLFLGVVVLGQQHALIAEQSIPLSPLLPLPSLSHLPPPSSLA
jgi:hypothetical protein